MFEQVTVPIQNLLLFLITCALGHLLHLDVERLMDVAQRLARIIHPPLIFTPIQAEMHKLEKRLHELRGVRLGVQTKFLNLLLTVIMLEQFSAQFRRVQHRPLDLKLR